MKLSLYSMGGRAAIAGLAVLLTGCGGDDPEVKAPALPETPWQKVKIEAVPLAKQKEGVTGKLDKHRAALAAATYPVLVPGDEAVLERLELVVKSHLYSAFAVFPTHRVQVLGVRGGKPNAADRLVLKDKRAEIEIVRWGVTYRVQIVCDSVAKPDLSLCADGKLVGAGKTGLDQSPLTVVRTSHPMSASIHFPEFRHYRVEHRLPLTALSALAAALLWPRASWAGMICLGVALVLALPMLWMDIGNALTRHRWAGSFARRVHPAGIGELVRAHHGRYRLHVRGYQGFGMNAIHPAVLVEDIDAGECFPVVPAVKDASVLAEWLGIPLEHH